MANGAAVSARPRITPGIFVHTFHTMVLERKVARIPQRWKLPWRRETPDRGMEDRQTLEESLEHTRVLLAQAYAGFNYAADGELVESYVYEIQALQTRYSYLLRQRKALEVPAALQGAVQPALPAV